MATISMNSYLLDEMKQYNQELEGISYDPITNSITYNGNTISLKNFPLSDIYNQYSQLKSDIEVINPIDLLNIISINVAANDKDSKIAEQINDTIPHYIQDIKLDKEIDASGKEVPHVCLITNDGIEHIIYDYEPSIVLNTIKAISSETAKNMKQISKEELFNRLDKKKEQDEKNNDGIIKIDTDKLISVSEYILLVEKTDALTSDETAKKNYFEKFVSNMYTYKSYLGEDALVMWNQYEQFIIVSNILGESPQNTQNAINYYNGLQDNAKQIELKNAENKNLLLTRREEEARKRATKENRAGVASALLIVEITTFVSIALATAIYVLLKI